MPNPSRKWAFFAPRALIARIQDPVHAQARGNHAQCRDDDDDDHQQDVACGVQRAGADEAVNFRHGDLSAAQQSHDFVHNGWECRTTGNPYAHVILRGAVDPYGNCIPNYHYESLIQAAEAYQARELKYPLIIVDTNHANSNKKWAQQPRIAREVMHSRRHVAELRDIVRGFMIESYLEDGAQKLDENTYGKSITDACLGWEETEDFVRQLAEEV